MKRVLLADVDVVVLSALGLLLRRKLGIPEICEVGSAEQLMECIAKFRPDMLLLDWNLPGLNVARIRGELQRSDQHPVVIVMSLEAENEGRALSSGADGFLNKHASGDCVVEFLKKYIGPLSGRVGEDHINLGDTSLSQQ